MRRNDHEPLSPQTDRHAPARPIAGATGDEGMSWAMLTVAVAQLAQLDGQRGRNAVSFTVGSHDIDEVRLGEAGGNPRLFSRAQQGRVEKASDRTKVRMPTLNFASMEFRAIEIGREAVRIRAAVGEPLLHVVAVDKVQRNHRVRVRHLGSPHQGWRSSLPSAISSSPGRTPRPSSAMKGG